jgi:hypothetical protein
MAGAELSIVKVLGISALLVTSAAIGQTGPTSGPNNEPNQIVCIKEKQIGSRLSTAKVCRTRAEWEQVRSQTRQVVERVQGNKATTCPPNC